MGGCLFGRVARSAVMSCGPSHRGGARTLNGVLPHWGLLLRGSCRAPAFRTGTVLLVSLPECWLATNTLVGRKPVALLRAMTLRRRSGSDLSLNLYGIRALPKRDEAA